MAFLPYVQARCDWLTCLQRTGPSAAFKLELDKTMSVIVAQMAAHKDITPEMASKCIGMVSRCMDEDSVAKLANSMRPLVDVAAPLDNESKLFQGINFTTAKSNLPAPLQISFYWHRYLTASLWALYSSSATFDEKIHQTAIHMQKLGMKHPAEKMGAYAAGLIHYATEGYTTDPNAALATGKKIKEMLKQRWMYSPELGPEEVGPAEYPATTEVFKVENPRLYTAAFGQELPVICPFGDDN